MIVEKIIFAIMTIRESGHMSVGRIPSYPKVYNLGHRYIEELFLDPVIVQEKIDGSQISFMRTNDGELLVRTRGQQLDINAPPGMFAEGVEYLKLVAHNMTRGWIYRAEYLQKPKHNTLVYDRIPLNHFMLFDVETSESTFEGPEVVRGEADSLGIEPVPYYHSIGVDNMAELEKMMETVSVLGGQLIEGLVFKNYNRFGRDGKMLAGKHVSEKFKEVQQSDWKNQHPGRNDVVEKLIAMFCTQARWEKAVQHLREAGTLEDVPQDIGPLIREIQADVEAEGAEEIAALLTAWAMPQIKKGVVRGFPEWYKHTLAERQFS